MSGARDGGPLVNLLTTLRYGLRSKRSAIGLFALALLVVGGGIYLAGVVASSFASIAGPLLRAGLVLGALWLAWPQLATFIRNVPYWLAVGLTIVLFVGILRPWFLFVVIPLGLLLWFLGPVLARKFQPPSTSTKSTHSQTPKSKAISKAKSK